MKLFSKRVLQSSIIAILFFFVVHRWWFGTTGVIEQGASYVLYPIIKIQSVITSPFKQFFKRKEHEQALRQMLFDLRQDYEALQARAIALQAERDYLADTHELRAFAQKYTTEKKILTQIIGKHFSPAQHFFFIDAGSKHGIEKDMVAVYKNCLVGKVTHVYPFYSKVMLVTDPHCKVAAYCSETKAEGIHEGLCKKDTTTLNFVSHLNEMHKDDLVLSSGQGTVYPCGFALGKVAQYVIDDLYYDVTIKPLVALSDLAYCYLIKKGWY